MRAEMARARPKIGSEDNVADVDINQAAVSQLFQAHKLPATQREMLRQNLIDMPPYALYA